MFIGKTIFLWTTSLKGPSELWKVFCIINFFLDPSMLSGDGDRPTRGYFVFWMVEANAIDST